MDRRMFLKLSAWLPTVPLSVVYGGTLTKERFNEYCIGDRYNTDIFRNMAIITDKKDKVVRVYHLSTSIPQHADSYEVPVM